MWLLQNPNTISGGGKTALRGRYVSACCNTDLHLAMQQVSTCAELLLFSKLVVLLQV